MVVFVLYFLTLVSAGTELLFTWCLNDAACAENYHISELLQTSPSENLDDRPLDTSAEVFRFLAERWVPELRQEPQTADDLRRLVEQRFEFRYSPSTSEAERESSVRVHWLLLLRLSAAENRDVHCGTNERLVVSPETLDAYCDCISNRNCDDGGNWRSRWNIATLSTVSVSLLVFLYLVVSIVHYGNKIHFFHEYRELQRTAAETRDELIKKQ